MTGDKDAALLPERCRGADEGWLKHRGSSLESQESQEEQTFCTGPACAGHGGQAQ